MSHQNQRDFVRTVSNSLPSFFSEVKVLEVGSLNINGTVRDFFSNCEYLGIDIAPGKGVDLVCEGQRFDAPDSSFDQVISCEVMEHNPHWKETFNNMIRVCKPGGLVTMTCATTGRPEHGTTRSSPTKSPLTVEQGWDYYRNLHSKDFRSACNLERDFVQHQFWTNWRSFDLCFVGLKRSPTFSDETAQSWTRAVQSVDEYISGANQLKICRYRALLAKLAGDSWFNLMRKAGRTLTYVHTG